MRFKFFVCIFLCQFILINGFTQSFKFTHSFEASILSTFKPSRAVKIEPSPNNPGLDYIFPIFKGYKYPGAMFSYRVGFYVKNRLSFFGTISSILRYMEPLNNSNHTFYSFPARLGIERKIINSKQRVYSMAILGGYNFKHPKYKYSDGIGGASCGISIRQQHQSKSHYLKFGIDYVQERSIIFWKYSQFLPNGIDETMRFNSHLFQASFGFGIFFQQNK